MVAQSVQSNSSCVILQGDCLEVLRTLEDNSVDSVVTDPPYGLSREPDIAEVLRHWLAGDRYAHNGSGFMGKSWDSFVPGPEYWREAARVLKPGGHVAAFGGTRTVDLLAIAIRMAGLEIREQLYWAHGQGFPKSLDVSKAIDKAAGASREVQGERWRRSANAVYGDGKGTNLVTMETMPATDAAREWSGFGTALKPAVEPIILARKPLAEPTVAANVLLWRTGALNIDGSRVALQEGESTLRALTPPTGWKNSSVLNGSMDDSALAGRWPPNLVLSHGANCTADACDVSCAIRELDAQSGVTASAARTRHNNGEAMGYHGASGEFITGGYSDTGGASRFYPRFAPDPDYDAPFLYTAKASRSERNAGCEKLPQLAPSFGASKGDGLGRGISNTRQDLRHGNNHPTVKSISLMSWLVRLITPPGGLVLDPFAGSGSTGVACAHLGFDFIGIERESEYVAIAQARIAHAQGVQIPAPPTRLAAKQPPKKPGRNKTPPPFAQIALFD